MIRVLLVDDHRLVRDGLATLLAAAGDMEVVGTAADGAEVVAAATACEPDVVLMDLSMPEVDGVQATKLLLAERPEVRVVALTSFSEQRQVADALAAGAVGYLLKDTAPDVLFEAIRAAHAGHAPLDPRVTKALLPSNAKPSPVAAAGLSAREVEVLRLAAKGLANKQIARSLGISEHTVKIHLGNVFRRIGVNDRTSAALWAKDNLDPDG
ncbi:MAG TPA: response regulator transcription factor [Jatrophihabitans sp.]|jgi:DNA-binding NarL/FixJ family response regulator|nr:response regulator transcription factor [Jatrophihabitans sp.]